MKAAKWPILILILSSLLVNNSNASSTSKLSNIFTLDTRTQELPPVDGWQILTNKGNTYNEDLLIDKQGKVWCFYFRTPGANQPVYLKIFKQDGYVYKSEQIVGYSSNYTESQYNSIRAAVNDSTQDVWVAIQGSSEGYFVIFDSTGTVKQDSTVLNKYSVSPKVTPGKNGKMWFSWHTQFTPNNDSQGKFVCYSANGEIFSGPYDIGRHTYLMNTDIAVDDSNRIWTVFEVNQGGDYFTKFSIYNDDLTIFNGKEGMIVSNNTLPVNPQRQVFSDEINQRMWILAKDITISAQDIYSYSLNGTNLNTIENVGDCGFVRNEKNFLEVLRFNDENQQNKIYESWLYNTQDGSFYSNQALFDSTFQFVKNGIAYNQAFPNLKVYAVNQDSNLTKLKFNVVSQGGPEISVKSVSFDTTKIIQTYIKRRDVKVLNVGSAILEVYNIIPNDPHFTVTNTSFQVLPNQNQVISVYFKPTDTDSLVRYLLFLSNDPVSDSLKVTVSGKGYNPTIPKITVDKDSLEFETIILGNAQTKHIYVYNDDKYEPLKISSIKSSDSQFTTVDSLGFTLNAKKGKYVGVIFRPNYVGTIRGILTINSNDTSNSSLQIPLRGTGVQLGGPKIAVNPDSLFFGEVALGHQKSLYLEIKNEGGTTLQINDISAADTQFYSNRTNFSISPYSRQYVLITYQGKRLGPISSNIVINSTDPAYPFLTVPVTGFCRESLPPTISISHDSLKFATVPINQTRTQYVWIYNSGEESLYIRNIYTNDKRFIVYQEPFTINPGQQRTVSVTFSPNDLSTVSDSLVVVSNDPQKDTSVVHLLGSGRELTEPQMVLSTERIEFGTLPTTQSVTKTFSIYNAGEKLLSVSNITASPYQQSFTIYPTVLNISSHQSRLVNVTFSPQQIGEITADLNITSNDPLARTISLRGNGRQPYPQQIQVSTTNINFEEVPINQSSNRYLWIKNVGERILNVTNISNNNNNFTLSAANLTLNPGQGQYIFVTFTPDRVTFYRDTLTIQSDDPDNQFIYIYLTGSGRELYAQNIQVSDESITFGEVPINQSSIRGITIYNTGEKNLFVSYISNANTAFLVDQKELNIAPQSNQTVYVTFRPEALIIYQDTLKIINDDPDTPLVVVPVGGTGRSLRDQKIVIMPDSLNFGYVGVGLTSDKNIQIRNDGEVNLEIDSIKINHANFSIQSDTSFSLRPGHSNWLSVIFTPTGIDTFRTTMSVFSNDPDSGNYRIPLIGYGRELLEPNITFYPGELDLGDVAIGYQKTANLWIGNDGEKELNVSSVVSNNDQFTVEPTMFSVQPGYRQQLSIYFKPLEIGIINTSLTIMSNDPDSNVASVPLRGEGRTLRSPQLSYSPEELNFGKVLLGDSLVKYITFQNIGDLPLDLFQISVDDSSFKAERDSIRIEGSQYQTLYVTFTPKDTLLLQAYLKIYSNDPENYLINIPLQGSGRHVREQFVVSPSNLDFGKVLIHTTSTNPLWFSNRGDIPLTILNIYSDNNKFTPRKTSFLLEPNNNQQILVDFMPDSIQTYLGNLTIKYSFGQDTIPASNLLQGGESLEAFNNSYYVDSLIVPLSGAGRDSIRQHIVIVNDSINFETVALQNTKTHSLKIKNEGEKSLEILNIENSDSVFSVNKKQFQIPPNSYDILYVSFTPVNPISYTDSLRVISNDPQNDTLFVKLVGTGREPTLQQIAVSDNVLNFGTVLINKKKSLYLHVSNFGERNLEINQIAISDSQFSVTEPWFIVKPQETHYLIVNFNPMRDDTVNARLTLKNNDPTNPEVVITLNGRGLFYDGPQISLQPNSLYFGNTILGVTKKQSFWVVNSSSKDTLKVNSISIDQVFFTASRLTLSIPPNDSAAVQISYNPLSVGSHSANIAIYSNDMYQSPIHLSVSGNGIIENRGEYTLSNLGWKENGYTPFGQFFSPNPHTDDVLSEGPDRAWFLKDIKLFAKPGSAILNVCFDDSIYIYINGTFIFAQGSYQPIYWNIENYDVKHLLRLGTNRIAILVMNTKDTLGGFDCELIVDGESFIKRGDQNWMSPDATWWYYGFNGNGIIGNTPPNDLINNRLWFYSEYSLSGIDSVSGDWTFEPGASDTLYDSSPYGQRAILHNITWVPGVVGYAMQFSGQSDSYVELEANLNSIPQTIELWLNCYGAQNYNQNVITNIGTGQFGMGLFIDPNMRLGVYYYDGIILTDFGMNARTWYFVSTQYKFNQILVYVNNSLIGTYSYSQGNPIGLNFSYLGGNPAVQDTSSFFGAIDELKIKNVASIPTQMQQVARISSAPPVSVIKDEEIELNFDIYPMPYQIINGRFEYTWGGSDFYQSKTLVYRDSTFNSAFKIMVPPDSVTVRGLKYRLTLQTNYGTVSYPVLGEPDQDYAWIEIVTDKENSDVAMERKVHRMISVPYILDNPSIANVLEDNLGIEDTYEWRLFDWSQEDTNYIAYDDSTWEQNNNFVLGKSFWLITRNDATFDAGAGRSPQNANFRINLMPGWNMVSNPFPYPVSWLDVAKTSEFVSDPIYRSTTDSIGWIYNTETLMPWEGYFVWNGENSDRGLIVPPIETQRILLKKGTLAKKYLSKYPDISILLSADVRCGKYMDRDNLFGVSKNASNNYDKFDLKEAPVIGDYVSLWIDNRSWEQSGGNYTIDIRQDGAAGYTWDLVLDYSLKNPENALITKFQSITELPANWIMYLFDLTEDVAINLHQQYEISIQPKADEAQTKRYKLVIGTEEFVLQNSENIPLIPLEFELFQNYPNPFNATTTISFNLPKKKHVTIKIYNILGQKVKTLMDEEIRGGHHKLIWNGLNDHGNMISTGLYILRLQTKNNVAVKKLLLIK